MISAYSVFLLPCSKVAWSDLATYGNPRATGDIDIWVRNTGENGTKVIRALAKFGAPITNITIEDFESDDTIIQIGVVPCRIDILTGIDGVKFLEAWTNKKEVEVDGIKLYVLSKADLLKNRLAANRDKDQSDIAWLKKNLGPEA